LDFLEEGEREETRVKANTVICSQSNYTQDRERESKRENRIDVEQDIVARPIGLLTFSTLINRSIDSTTRKHPSTVASFLFFFFFLKKNKSFRPLPSPLKFEMQRHVCL
jgi:hypothetical protein